MTSKNLSTVASDVIGSYGNTARNIVNTYRFGGERVIGFVDARFQNVLHRGATRLGPTTVGNIVAAQKRISGYYAKGIQLTTGGALTVIDTVVDLAEKSVERLAANADAFDKASGTGAFGRLSRIAMPGATVVSNVVGKIEHQAGRIATKIAVAAPVTKGVKAKAKRTVSRKPVVKAVRAKRAVTARRRAARS
jgi:hypothetical protein